MFIWYGSVFHYLCSEVASRPVFKLAKQNLIVLHLIRHNKSLLCKLISDL